MPFFSNRHTQRTRSTRTSHRPLSMRLGFRKDRDRVAGGYKGALSNPNTTHQGRRHAKRELRRMGRGNEAHVPLMTKIKRTLGIRSTPRSHTSTSGMSTHRRRRL